MFHLVDIDVAGAQRVHSFDRVISIKKKRMKYVMPLFVCCLFSSNKLDRLIIYRMRSAPHYNHRNVPQPQLWLQSHLLYIYYICNIVYC